MKKLFFFYLLLAVNSVYSQSWTWGIKATGTSQNYNAIDLDVDGDGNMIMAGYYRLNFNLGDFSLSSPDDYFRDIYLTKINSNKEVLWLKSIEADFCYGNKIDVKTDDNGNIYLTAQINSKIFIAKYDSNGNELWLNNFSDENYGYGTSISFDEEENIYLGGGSGNTFFMAKLNQNGETIWKKELWYSYSDAISISDIKVDKVGNIYFTGYYAAKEIKLNEQITLTNSSSNYRWCLFGKMDTNGNFIWAKNFQGTIGATPKLSLTQQNEIVITGSYYLNLKFDNEILIATGFCCGEYDSFLSKFDINGNINWLKRGTAAYVPNAVPLDSKIDFNGNIYILGTYWNYQNKSYVEKYDFNGNSMWRNNITYSENNPKALDLDNLGNLYYSGYNYLENFINPNASTTLSAGIGQFNTGSTTFNKIKKPIVSGNKLLCNNENSLSLSAVGENIKWYSDSQLTNLIGSDSNFNLSYTNDTKVYATQTINNIESWARVVNIKKSDLNINSVNLQYAAPRLSVVNNPEYLYQWYYNNILIPNANADYIDVANGNNYLDYSIAISHSTCSVRVDASSLSNMESKKVEYSIYPNPVSDSFTLDIPSNVNVLLLEVIDSSGKIVKTFTKNLKYDISKLPVGKYYIVVKTSSGKNIFSIIKK